MPINIFLNPPPPKIGQQRSFSIGDVHILDVNNTVILKTLTWKRNNTFIYYCPTYTAGNNMKERQIFM